jgi:hypothetical protein
MSLDVPEHIGELSRYAMQQADAPEDVRAALSVIRLVENMPRRVPWFGASIPTPEGDSVHAGTVMRCAFEALGDWIDGPTDQGLETKADHWFTKRWLTTWRQGHRDYDDYLTHLTDPARWEQESVETRLTAERAASYHEQAARYLAR